LGVQKPFFGYDSNDRVEKTAGLVDDVSQALVVGVGEIALERRGLNCIDGQNREQYWVPGKWVFI
jgi:hypothetical protein